MNAEAVTQPVDRGYRSSVGRIRYFSLHDDTDIRLDETRSILAEDELARAGKFRFARDRNSFLRGRALLRRELAAMTGDQPDSLRFTYAQHGKPGIAGADLHFNYSDSGGTGVLATSATGPVGVDIEWTDRKVEIDELADFVFSGDELRGFRNIPDERRRRRFFQFWTAKEARMKFSGEGLALEPRQISLSLAEDGEPKGFLRPERPRARLEYISSPSPDLICCLVSGLQ